MGVVVLCKNLSIHLSYTEFNFIKNYLLLLCIEYVKKNNTENDIEDRYLTDYKGLFIQNNIFGIPLLFEKNVFDFKESKQIINDVLIVNANNTLPNNVTNFCNLFLFSSASNSNISIK